MYRDHSIVAVVPAYKEENQVGRVIGTMPDWVDAIAVIDDCSPDRTAEVVRQHAAADPRVVLIRHESNQGVGGAIASGYKWARDHGYDVAVVMAGDGQMDPVNLPGLLDPIVNGQADYTKGNRLLHGEVFQLMPKVRLLGSLMLSLLTKIASGYWHIADPQNGYTAINRAALGAIDWDTMYKRYGQPNDLLVRLNVGHYRVRDVYMKPVYNVGEQSKILLRKVTFTIAWLLVRLFFWRLKEKYVIRDFHPLIFFYAMGFLLLAACAPLSVNLVARWVRLGFAPEMTTLALLFCFSTGLQSLFFAMWFDKDMGDRAPAPEQASRKAAQARPVIAAGAGGDAREQILRIHLETGDGEAASEQWLSVVLQAAADELRDRNRKTAA